MDDEELISEEEPNQQSKNGINLFVAVVILTGEMAGSGMLQLPFSMVGTGKSPLNAASLVKPLRTFLFLSGKLSMYKAISYYRYPCI